MTNLLRYKDNTYSAFDFETESLNTLRKNRPWEVGIVKFNKNKILETIHYYVNWPDLNVGAGAAAVTHFYEKEYKVKTEGVTPAEGYKLFCDHVLNLEIIPVAHNSIGFDTYIEKIWRKELNLEPDYSYLNRFIDTNSLAKGYKMGIQIPKYLTEEFLQFLYQMKNTPVSGVKTSIPTLCKELGIDFDPSLAHAADYDSLKTAEILQKYLWLVEI